LYNRARLAITTITRVLVTAHARMRSSVRLTEGAVYRLLFQAYTLMQRGKPSTACLSPAHALSAFVVVLPTRRLQLRRCTTLASPVRRCVAHVWAVPPHPPRVHESCSRWSTLCCVALPLYPMFACGHVVGARRPSLGWCRRPRRVTAPTTRFRRARRGHGATLFLLVMCNWCYYVAVVCLAARRPSTVGWSRSWLRLAAAERRRGKSQCRSDSPPVLVELVTIVLYTRHLSLAAHRLVFGVDQARTVERRRRLLLRAGCVHANCRPASSTAVMLCSAHIVHPSRCLRLRARRLHLPSPVSVGVRVGLLCIGRRRHISRECNRCYGHCGSEAVAHHVYAASPMAAGRRRLRGVPTVVQCGTVAC
jgi:hypothetical protein